MFYSIPAFSVGSITAGFCAEHPVHAPKRDDNKPKDGLQCIRFIRDDQAGVFLHFYENERTSVTEVVCLTHKSSTRRTRVRMGFDMHPLRTAVLTPRGTLHPADIAASLIHINVSDEKRSCPVCKDPTATNCSCTLPLRRPHHPLDFQFEASNMDLYRGFFQGATVVRLYSANHDVINVTLQSCSVIQGELNSEITAKLHKMAVIDRFTNVKERLASFCMPASHLNLTAMSPVEVPEDVEARDEGVEQNSNKPEIVRSEIIDAGGFFFNEPKVATDDLDCSNALMGKGDLLVVMDTVDKVCSEATQAHTDQTVTNMPALEDRESGSSGDKNNSQDGGGNDGFYGGFGSVVGTVNAEAGGDQSFPIMFSSWGLRSSKLTDLETGEKSSIPIELGDEEKKMGAGYSLGSGGKSSGGKSSLGRCALTSTALAGAVGLDKTEIRKRQNRASAARSNLKRKLRDECLEADLASLRQRASTLKLKETLLRDENTRLQTALRCVANVLLPKVCKGREGGV